jgi:hypothetical protein
MGTPDACGARRPDGGGLWDVAGNWTPAACPARTMT